jgi:hypothetical protein
VAPLPQQVVGPVLAFRLTNQHERRAIGRGEKMWWQLKLVKTNCELQIDRFEFIRRLQRNFNSASAPRPVSSTPIMTDDPVPPLFPPGGFVQSPYYWHFAPTCGTPLYKKQLGVFL